MFAAIAILDEQAAGLFVRMVETGPNVLANLPASRQATILAEIATAFKAAFATITAYAVIAIGLAWSIPVRRL